MKTSRPFTFRLLAGLAGVLGGAVAGAAPLEWFPGPAVDPPLSGAATTFLRSLGNVLLGGDGYANYYYPVTYPQSLAATNGHWNYLPPMYSLRIAPGAVANGGLIILYGGSDGTNSTSTAVGYSPSGDPLLTLASMSVARAYCGYAPDASGNAYALGGLDDNGQPLASAERYNADLDIWESVAALPVAQYDFPAVFGHTNGIYIFGGRTNTSLGTETATVLRYSVAANGWSRLAPMPVATAGSAAAFGADGKIYVVGGVSGGAATNLVQVYDPVSNSWAVSTPLPEALSASSMGVDSLGRLILMGGVDANGNDVGDVWRSQELGAPDTAPVFVSYPGTSATYHTPYTSSINATGNPQPVYLLLSGPTGMQVDIYSGAISWTPQAGEIGSNAVTIRATNYAGFVDWNFAITVPYPPPAVPTNLTVVGVTDNSVTLAWAPEDPVVGPVTYGAYLRHFVHSPRGGGGTVWFTQIGTNSTQPTITITGLTPGFGQVYYVAASAPGGKSGYSAGVAATTTAPHGPTNLWVTALTSTSVGLAWTPSPGPAQSPLYSLITTYTIMERNMSVSPPANVPTVANISGTHGTVTGLTPGRSHLWFVSGVDSAGNASPLTFVYVVVTNPVPMAPQVGAGGPLPNGNFQFTVQESGPVVQTVIIQANADPTNPAGWVQIGSLLPGGGSFTFTDTNAALYPARFYRVLAP